MGHRNFREAREGNVSAALKEAEEGPVVGEVGWLGAQAEQGRGWRTETPGSPGRAKASTACGGKRVSRPVLPPMR